MPRNLSIAVVYSFAIHLVAFLIADNLLRDRSQPSIITTPLIVHIEPSQAAGEETDISSETTTSEAEAPKPSEIAQPAAAPAAVESPTVMPEPQVAALDFITTTATSRRIPVAEAPPEAQPVAARADLSSGQREMLDRKLQEWSDELRKMPDRASELTWSDEGLDYVARFTELPAGDDMGIERIVVEISTERDGQRLSSEVQFRRLAFSNYAQFVNRWDPNVEIHDDELDGRFHSNSAIYVAYDGMVKPRFNGKVTTASHRVNYTRRRGSKVRNEVFAGGLQTGVRRIGLPKRFLPFPDQAELSEDQVHRFADDTRITFRADGTFESQAIDSDAPAQTSALSRATTYLIADRKAELHVSGTVNGKVLVYSPERIVIEGNLVYAQTPGESRSADDYVGLVSDKNVEIAAPDVTGPGDLAIHAAIYAKRRFNVRRYRSGDDALLFLFGSLSAGSMSATEPRYHTRIQFDHRLEELRPPGFPVTDRYEVESWDAVWQVDP